MFRPPGFDPVKSYPIIESCWSSNWGNWLPQGAFGNTTTLHMSYYWPAALAALGFIVVMIDGRGSPARSKAFSDCDYGNPAMTVKIDDSIAGIKQLAARYPFMDLKRVGVTSPETTVNSVYALVNHSDFYKVAVQHPFVDPRFGMVSIYEPYNNLGPGYRFDDPRHAEYNVDKFDGKLLLIAAPRTPAAAGQLRLVEALQKAHRDFDMLALPKLGGQMTGYTVRREWDYFITHLQGNLPPKEFKLVTLEDIINHGGVADKSWTPDEALLADV
jgi:hypothetical protein